MAEYKFTAAINPAVFPFISAFQNRPILISGMDNRLRAANSGVRDNETNNNPSDLPSIMYCENVIATQEGIKSVGYTLLQNEVPAETLFNDVYQLRDALNNFWYFSPANGLNYVIPNIGSTWTSTDPLVGTTDAPVSLAYVNGRQFVCYQGTRLLEWDGTNFIDQSLSLSGVAIADIVAIGASGNYLCLLCTDLSFKWSSLVDPLDFVPDDTTGAGSQIPADARGGGVYLTQLSGGVLIHFDQNTVAALTTNNSAQPWVFREVRNAGGLIDYRGVSTDNISGNCVMWGTHGFQIVGLRDAENIFPALTDYLAGNVFETFDSATNQLTIQRDVGPYSQLIKLNFFLNRYYTISYMATDEDPDGEYSYALIYDIQLKRWAKLKIGHKDIFLLAESPRDSLMLIKENGAGYLIDINYTVSTGAGVVIMGRYQLNRTNQICSQEVELEVLSEEDNPTVHVATNYDGRTVANIEQMIPYISEPTYRSYQKQLEGENISFIVKGTFSLSTMLVTVIKGAASGS